MSCWAADTVPPVASTSSLEARAAGVERHRFGFRAHRFHIQGHRIVDKRFLEVYLVYELKRFRNREHRRGQTQK